MRKAAARARSTDFWVCSMVQAPSLRRREASRVEQRRSRQAAWMISAAKVCSTGPDGGEIGFVGGAEFGVDFAFVAGGRSRLRRRGRL